MFVPKPSINYRKRLYQTKKKTDRKDLDGGALYRRKPTITDKIAEGAAMFVNPTASWSGTL